MANGGGGSQSLTFALAADVSGTGTLIQLSGAKGASNTPASPNAVVPKTSSITTTRSLRFTAPPYSFSVLLVPVAISSANGTGCIAAQWSQCGGEGLLGYSLNSMGIETDKNLYVGYNGCTTCAAGCTCFWNNQCERGSRLNSRTSPS